MTTHTHTKAENREPPNPQIHTQSKVSFSRPQDLFENRILLEREKKMLPILVFEFVSRCILLHASLRSFESLNKWLQDDDEREFGEAVKQWITFWGVRNFVFFLVSRQNTQRTIIC